MRKSAIYELKKSATGNTNSVKKLRFFFLMKKKRNSGKKNSMNPTETNRSTSRKRLSGLEAQNE